MLTATIAMLTLVQVAETAAVLSGNKRKAGADGGGGIDAERITHWSESLPPLRRACARPAVAVEDILVEEMVQVRDVFFLALFSLCFFFCPHSPSS